MPINHKFSNIEPGGFPDNDFYTEDVILKNGTYKPEVMVLGTFNPNTPNANFADFFYGRNYFWTGFKKLLYPNYQFIHDRRLPQNGQYNHPNDPFLDEILNLCSHFKITFSDFVSGVFPNVNPIDYEILPNDNVIYEGHEFNLIQDNAGDGVLGLADLDQMGLVSWNTLAIIEFLINNPQIKHVYFTRQANGVWGVQWNLIKYHPRLNDRHFSNIVTPSGRGRHPNPGEPFETALKKMLHYWIWNNLNHPTNPVQNPNFDHLDHDWLTRCGVDIIQF